MTILHGDCLELMATMDANSVDAIVTDPPYELGFMGKKWDGTGIAFDLATWEACLRVLKPGGTMLCFGGTRTFHRIAVAIEDAGFQLKDTLSWLHGQGFPKGKAQLKPAWEPIIMARKPGSAVLQIDACRVGTDAIAAHGGGRNVDGRKYGGGTGIPAIEAGSNPHIGRWPANVILDETAASLLDAMSGERKSPRSYVRAADSGNKNAYGKGIGEASGTHSLNYGDTGGASRFFYCAKSSRSERNAGLDGMPEREGGAYANGAGMPGRTLVNGEWVQTGTWQEPNRTPRANHHPTVKPLSLMRWLVRLVTPPGGIILDPFTGSGSTGCAAVQEGFTFIGIEREAEYVDIARNRIAHWTPKPEPQLILALEVAS